MPPIQVLLVAFLSFLWTAPVVLAEPAPISQNDPFRILALHAPREPEPPVCCLQPPPSRDSLEDEVLLSFEEWKRRQLWDDARVKEDINHSTQASAGAGSGSEADADGNQSANVDVGSTEESLYSVDDLAKPQPTELIPPHFRVPLTDRFNYASSECSARVHLAHRSAKSSPSILSFKRDRYMLSPCNSKERHFVVVELCEDIMIDTVQLANFEFFSGVFKDFKVSVAKTYETDGWIDAGVYRAKNIRGVQSFHPPRSLRDFYRYIRIDFLSHYGNEFYCPVSLLRVYGLTHLEQYKWDTWETESRAKVAKELHSSVSAVVTALPASRNFSEPSTEGTLDVNISSSASPFTDVDITPKDTSEGTKKVQDEALSTTSASHVVDQPSSIHSTIPETTIANAMPDVTTSEGFIQTNSILPISSIIIVSTISARASITTAPSASGLPFMPEAVQSSTPRTLSTSSPPSPPSLVKSVSTTPAPPTATASISSHPVLTPITTGGESIYRTIMNRLTALEANHTLYVRYIEQQNNGVREVLKRLTEDVGRLEGITRGHIAGYQRRTREWEQQQQELHMEYRKLLMRVEYLSGEIILEKRIGIAQLCLLMIVLVFMGLTRGSRAEHVSVKEWGKRHLSFSFRPRGRSTSMTAAGATTQSPPQSTKVPTLSKSTDKVEFPSKQSSKRAPLAPSDMNIRPTRRDVTQDDRILQPLLRQQSRSRTPSFPGCQHQNRPITPVSGHRTQQPRSNSRIGASPMTKTLSGSGTGHRSAKRAGHTAHWHVFRGTRRTDGSTPLNGRENRGLEPFGGSPSASRRHNHRREDSDDIFGPSPLRKENEVPSGGWGRPKRRDTTTEEPEWEDTDFEGSETGFD